jgi:hypothetical protein
MLPSRLHCPNSGEGWLFSDRGELKDRMDCELGSSLSLSGVIFSDGLSLCFLVNRSNILRFEWFVGDLFPSLGPPLVVVPLQVLIPLGVGLFDLFAMLTLEALPSAVPIEVGARSFLALRLESSLLTEGRSDLVSSVLLLCRWWCPGRCT